MAEYRSDGRPSCPRCGTPMEYRIEMEFGGNGGRRIVYYYRCPRCGYKVQDLVLKVRRSDGRIVVTVEEVVVRGGST